jgi:hypothetical protein
VPLPVSNRHDLRAQDRGQPDEWPQRRRTLHGRRLRALGIEIAFTREGHAGNTLIRIHNMFANTGSSERRERPPSQPTDFVSDNTYRPDLAGSSPIGRASVTATDDADGVTQLVRQRVSIHSRRGAMCAQGRFFPFNPRVATPIASLMMAEPSKRRSNTEERKHLVNTAMKE